MRARLLVIVTVAVVALLGIGVAADGAGAPDCSRAVRGLGMLAVVSRGRVEVIDLATCRTRVVARVSVPSPVGRANSPIVHFVGAGRWLAYATIAANGSLRGPFVVPVTGGRARAPLGSGLVAFTWAPDGSRLYGITGGGELVSAAPTGGLRVVARGLGGAAAFRSLAISADGRYAAVDISSCGKATSASLLRVDLRTGAVRKALRQKGEYDTLAGWSPDGRWMLYWPQSICSASLAADGFPLYAVSSRGGRPVRAVAHTLLYPDFLTWCGGRLIAASTPGRETETGGKLVESGPPAWRQRTIEDARRESWVSPSCSASGRVLVAAAGRSTQDAGFGVEHRSLYLLRADGAVIRRLSEPGAADLSDEAPRFSRGGRWVLFIRSRVVTAGTSAYSHDTLELVRTSGTGGAVPLLSFS